MRNSQRVVRFLLALVIVGFGAAAAKAGDGGGNGAVYVTDLPGGAHDISGVRQMGAQTLRIGVNQTGPVASWTDSATNSVVTSVRIMNPLNQVLLPTPKCTIEIKTLASDRVEATVTSPEVAGLRAIYTIEPGRWGVRVEGPAERYLINGSSPARGEGSRVVIGDQDFFPTCGIPPREDSRQLLIDALRTRAMRLDIPPKALLVWQYVPTGGWAEAEHVEWNVAVPPGQTVWITEDAIPARHGPVHVGLYNRAVSRPSWPPIGSIALSDDRFVADAPITANVATPIEKLVPKEKDGVLLAALIPIGAGDAVDSSEQLAWHSRIDRSEGMWIPVSATSKDAQNWELRASDGASAGMYRMRMWIVPRDLSRPEFLSGPKGAVINYFPGIVGRATQARQAYPMGDVFVTVMPSADADGAIALSNPSMRASFWRGETIDIDVRMRTKTPKDVDAELVIRPVGGDIALARRAVKLSGADASVGFAVSSANLAPGEYEARVSGGNLVSYPYRFNVAPPALSAMPLVNSPLGGPSELAAHRRIGITGWVDVMPQTGGHTPPWPQPAMTSRGSYANDPLLPAVAPASAGGYDEIVRLHWLHLQGVQSRQISFAIHHSVPEQVEETLRKHLIYAQIMNRFPSMLGLVFDYDLAGVGEGLGYAPSYIAGGKRRTQLLTEKWNAFWADAKSHGATDAEATRYATYFNADVIADIYRRSVAQLHEEVPGQHHTTCQTADHDKIEHGQYLPATYAPLDFRYLDIWNDQIYPCSSHDMQAPFWTSLLRMDRKANQPIWVNPSTAPQPGTHFRRSLESISYGANTIGFEGEGGAGLNGGWGATPTESNPRTAQEQLSGDLAKQYGSWLNQFAPREEVAILYSASQGGYNFGIQSPHFFLFYVLAHSNRPARLLTEEEIAAGALKEVKALLVVGQTAPVAPKTADAIRAFTDGGGKAFCDVGTSAQLPGVKKLAGFQFDRASLWPDGTNVYHNIIAGFAKKNGPVLREALGDAGAQALEPTDLTAALVNTTYAKDGSGSRIVFVTNETFYPLEAAFSADQQTSAFFRRFMRFSNTFYKDVRVPRMVTLKVDQNRVAPTAHLYDVFDGRELKVVNGTVTLDLATQLGRVVLISDRAIDAAPQVSVAKRDPTSAIGTIVVKSSQPLPIRVRVGGQEFFRAATPQGSCDTIAIGPAAGKAPVEVTEFVTGRTVSGFVDLTRPAQATVSDRPAVEARDGAKIRAVLQAKDLALYVDARQADRLDRFKSLAPKLSSTASVVFNPAIANYPVSWDPTKEQDVAKAAILGEHQVSSRVATEYYMQWTGALIPATAYNRPVVLIGNANDNRLIEDLNTTTVLDRPATRDAIAPGHAYIQPVASPFWNGVNGVVVMCADEKGFAAATEMLESIVAGGEIAGASSGVDDGGARADRDRLLGFGSSSAMPDQLVPLAGATVKTSIDIGLRRVVPISCLSALDDGGVIAAVHAPGRSLVRLDSTGRTVWRAIGAGSYETTSLVASGAGESFCTDENLIWRYGAGGRVLWKMLRGTSIWDARSPLDLPPSADGSVWSRTGAGLAQIKPSGEVTKTVDLPAGDSAIACSNAVVVVKRPGPTTQAIEKSGSSLIGIDLATAQPKWTVPNCDAVSARMSDDGSLVACVEHLDLAGRDDIESRDASMLAVVDASSGKVLLRAPLGNALGDVQISRDNRRVLASASGYRDVMYVADLATGLLRRVQLPEPGSWSRCFSADGNTLWVACDHLYRVDLATLACSAVAEGRFTQLVADKTGGVIAGSAQGTVCWFDRDGKKVREVDLLGADSLMQDPVAELAPLRDAPVVQSDSLLPHNVPCTIALNGEWDLPFGIAANSISLRGDGICPLRVSVRVPAAGKYRLTITMANPKETLDKVGAVVFQDATPGTQEQRAKPVGTDRLIQSADVDLVSGVHLLTILPREFQTDFILSKLTIEPVTSAMTAPAATKP